MHFKSTIAVAAGIASALPVQQDRRGLPLVGDLMGSSFMGSSQVQRYNSPNINPYEYGTGQNGANGGPMGIFGGILKKRQLGGLMGGGGGLPLVGGLMGGGGGGAGGGLPLVGGLMGGGGGGGGGLPFGLGGGSGGGGGLPFGLGGSAGGGQGGGLPFGLGGGGGQGGGLPFGLGGGAGGGGLPFGLGGGQPQQSNNPQYQPQSYPTPGGYGPPGVHKREAQDTQAKQHADCSIQCNGYCSQYFKDASQEQPCQQQCPQQCAQILVSPTQGGPQQYGSGQWQPGTNSPIPDTGNPGQQLADPTSQDLGVPPYQGSNNFQPDSKSPGIADPQSNLPQGPGIADPISQSAPQYQGSNGIASPVSNNLPTTDNGVPQGPGIADPQSNTFPQGPSVADPQSNNFPQGPGPQSNFPQGPGIGGQAFCNIFDMLQGFGMGGGSPGVSAPQGYGPPNTNQFQPQQSQCPLMQGGQWQNGQGFN